MCQGHKIQFLGVRSRCDAQPQICVAGGDAGGHSSVRGFFEFVARGQAGRRALVFQPLVQQQSGARAQCPVDQSQLRAPQVVPTRDVQGVTWGHHPALFAGGKSNEFVLTGFQQGLVSAGGQGAGIGLQGSMKPRDRASALIQGANRVHTATKAHVQVQGLAGTVLPEFDQRVVVAGIDRQQMAARVKGHCEGFFQFGLQGADLWRQSGLRLAFGPQQFVGKFCQAASLAFFPQDQRLGQYLLPAFEFPPNMAIGQLQNTGRPRNRAGFTHGLQHVHQGVAQRAGQVALLGLRLVGCPAVRKVDVLHGQEFASFQDGL